MEAGARGQGGAAERGERGQQRILCGGVRGSAQRREIGGENHRANGAGEILDDDGEGQRGRDAPDERQPRERQVRRHLYEGADPQAGRQRQSAHHRAAGKAADQAAAAAPRL